MTMIEKMARATLDALEREAVFARAVNGNLAECEVDGGLFDMRIVMRSALTAMLEPSQAMIEAGWRSKGDDIDGTPAWKCRVDVVAEHQFKAMIQDALDEKQP